MVQVLFTEWYFVSSQLFLGKLLFSKKHHFKSDIFVHLKKKKINDMQSIFKYRLKLQCTQHSCPCRFWFIYTNQLWSNGIHYNTKYTQ